MTSLLNHRLSFPHLIFHSLCDPSCILIHHRSDFRGKRFTNRFVPSFAQMPINGKVRIRRIGNGRGEVNYVARPSGGDLKEVAGQRSFERSCACGVNADGAADPVCLLNRVGLMRHQPRGQEGYQDRASCGSYGSFNGFGGRRLGALQSLIVMENTGLEQCLPKWSPVSPGDARLAACFTDQEFGRLAEVCERPRRKMPEVERSEKISSP